jgi:hypothetical protein
LNTDELALSTENFLPDKEMFTQFIERFIPKVNFAWQYNGIAKYNGYLNIPNSGNKRRQIRFGNYAPSEILNFGQGEKPFHNRYRETSVYLSLNGEFDHQHSNVIDNSRYTAGFHSSNNPTDIDDTKTTRAYYGSVKVYRPNQYGPLTNLRYLSTGYSVDVVLNKNNGLAQMVETYYPAFGGDTFITGFALKRKHSFFRQNLAGKPDDIPFNYYLFPNLGYPTYFYGFQQDVRDFEQFLRREITQLIGWVAAAGIAALAASAFGDGLAVGKTTMSILKATTQISLLDSVNDLLGGLGPYLFLDKDVNPSPFRMALYESLCGLQKKELV